MLEDYVLGAEVAEKGDFHIANISMLFKDLPLIEGIDFLKFGGITLLNKKSLAYPKYIRTIMDSNEMTNLSEYIPLTLFKEILDNNLNLVKDKYDVAKICSKQFVKISDVELREVLMDGDLVKSVVFNDEVNQLMGEELIIGSIKLSNKKSLIWY